MKVTPNANRSILWNLVTGPVVLGLNLILVPISIYVAGASDYGVWALCFGAASLLGQADLGLGTSVVRQLAAWRAQREVEREGYAKTVAMGLFLCLGITLSLTMIPAMNLYFSGRHVSDELELRWFLIPAAASLLLMILSRYSISVIQSYGWFYPERILAILGIVVRGCILLTGLVTGAGIGFVIVADISAVVVLVFGSALYMYYSGIGPEFNIIFAARSGVTRPLLQFGVPTFLSSISSLVALQAPLFFVGWSAGYADAAVYSAITRIFMSARMSFGWVTGPSLPEISAAAHVSDHRGIARKNVRSVLILCAVVSCLVAPCLVAGDELLGAWLGAEFSEFGPVLAIVSIAIFLYALYAPGVVFATALGHPGVVAVQNVLLCGLTVVLCVFLVPDHGAEGAAIASLLGIGILFPVNQVSLKKITGFPWLTTTFLCVLYLSLLSLLVWISGLILDDLSAPTVVKILIFGAECAACGMITARYLVPRFGGKVCLRRP
ncbi:lipopolysaccharide biosynthesis protein [Rhodococcus sp. JVH1]|uniref:lipopolysaccharide biosynthesis protein n=1 Tax=Rhodococcus sp. JVH1 TaxID=745408 RepID=UPI0012F64A1A|nr:polysaccharide biosynthesis C-terminal domain-containing protein [Rhodococcus sp. JVH1]